MPQESQPGHLNTTKAGVSRMQDAFLFWTVGVLFAAAIVVVAITATRITMDVAAENRTIWDRGTRIATSRGGAPNLRVVARGIMADAEQLVESAEELIEHLEGCMCVRCSAAADALE
jgi:hypothetical protein